MIPLKDETAVQFFHALLMESWILMPQDEYFENYNKSSIKEKLFMELFTTENYQLIGDWPQAHTSDIRVMLL